MPQCSLLTFFGFYVFIFFQSTSRTSDPEINNTTIAPINSENGTGSENVREEVGNLVSSINVSSEDLPSLEDGGIEIPIQFVKDEVNNEKKKQ